MVEEATARQIVYALADTVKRGTATGIATALGDCRLVNRREGRHRRPRRSTMDEQYGCFAGLIFDNQGKARYTVEISAPVAGVLAEE
jgi:hypothetical protein